jgi:Na+/H+ antiporter NhaD/arsenite permease-like protein
MADIIVRTQNNNEITFFLFSLFIIFIIFKDIEFFKYYFYS